MLIVLLLTALLLTACGEPKTVNCDSCGKPQRVEKGSNVSEDWIVYCDACYTKLFGKDGLVSGN